MPNEPANFDQARTGHGTKEWADINYNIGKGCAHGCLYCYACHIQLRLKRISSREEWLKETVKPKAIGIKTRQPGIIMYPSSHDITPFYLDQSIAALHQMLSVGNQVLIVSKPHIECVRTLVAQLARYKSQILFRFTIGALDEALVRLWEPQAPPPAERLEALDYVYAAGFGTSVSIEPMLAGVDETLRVVEAVKTHVSKTIWIGKMNRIRQRVDMSTPEITRAVESIEQQQSDKEVRRLYSFLNDNPRIRWKDSIKQIVAAGSCRNLFSDLSHCGLCDRYGVYP